MTIISFVERIFGRTGTGNANFEVDQELETRFVGFHSIPVVSSSYKSLLRFKRSAFLKNILIVMSGTAVAQAIGYMVTPVISRLFSPSDFGVFGSFSAVTGIISAGITLEYSQAIMLPKEEKDALHLFHISCLSTVVISCLCMLACFFASAYIMELIRAPSAWLLAVLVVTIVIGGINISLQAWCVRTKAFKQTSVSQVIRSISANGMQLAFGVMSAGPLGLIVSSTVGELLASLNLLRVFLASLRKLRYKTSWLRMRQLAGEYRDFPIYSGSANIINALSQGLPVLLLTNYFGIGVAGAYAFGLRIISAPMALILRALRQVLFQKACETDHHNGSLLNLYVKTTLGLFAVAMVPSAILVIWAPQIFSFVFGQKWLIAGSFTRSLVLWQVFMFCNLPSVLFSRVLRLQRQLFGFDIVLLAARVATLVIGGMFMSASMTIFVFSLIGAIMNAIFILIVGFLLIKKEGVNTRAEVMAFIKNDW